ncbi:hypothetical protein HM1_2151 [Heliomicrobium modesticaldum Ice1]|uniref:Small, acid-soluble spore protein, alpha/beta type n=1 Tax=Heliobacterium modesticaldum (strain ATCC 51547 / Ice1) TaxID=498761 RepID=B0TGU6_HELMI|nr:small, acid-soluble spore protein, alpha/beta type [Heliomicrobium modesticaldum]ABZ84707.1 hypothetical protein HM1_2151 [Heliomicrobium modesticaldum Ice1]
MPERDRDELSPQLEDLKMEVAQEIGLGHRFQGAKKDGATTGAQPGKRPGCAKDDAARRPV